LVGRKPAGKVGVEYFEQGETSRERHLHDVVWDVEELGFAMKLEHTIQITCGREVQGDEVFATFQARVSDEE
jgi:hypothetical protein